MIALDYLTAIRFSGADAGDFLHNQLSSDVLALPDSESVFACYCEPKGRVLALMLVCRVDEGYYVIMSRALATTVTNRLKMYVMRSKVSIEVLNETPVTGLPEVGALEPATTPTLTIPIPGSNKSLSILAPDTTTDINTYLRDAWKASELEQGICWLCPETSAQFLPQMLGFDQLGAVNFRKGCYPGQEIVARTHYLGKVKRHPRLLRIVTDICQEPLEKIRILSDDKDYEAIIVDCGRDEDGRTCLFVVTRMDPGLTAEQVEYQGQVVALA
jgi:folate-binding protein YgfZ